MADPSPSPTRILQVCVPADADGVRHLGDMPSNVELRPSVADGRSVDLSSVDMVVADGSMAGAVLAALGAPGRLRVIQTLSAGVDCSWARSPTG